MITCGGREAEKSIFEIDFDQGEQARNGFRERRGVLVHGAGERVVQRIAYTDQARRELGRAVRTADGLVRRLGVTRYPSELSRVVGHRPDGGAPYLVATRRGGTLAELSGRLPLEPGQLWTVVDGVVAVLTQLSELRLVHRDIRPETLLWDGARVQLTESGLTAHEGEERRTAVGTDPWRCPEQAAGLGTADCRDDVYSAGAVLFHLATGEEVGPTPDMRHRVQYLDSSLRTLLDGVFTDQSRQRVSGFALRRRREGQGGARPAYAPGRGHPTSVSGLETQARDTFRELRARQRAFNERAAHPASRTPGAPDLVRTRETVSRQVVLAVSLLLLVVLAVLVMALV